MCYVNSVLGQENQTLSKNLKVVFPFNKSYRKIQWPLGVVVIDYPN